MAFDVLVAGSLHLDIMVAADRLPVLDETLIGSSWHYKTGGKGGNQACAVARAGARVAMLGAVGDDDFGRRLLQALDIAKVDRNLVTVEAGGQSGMSVALVNANQDYAAVVVSGVNRDVAPPDALPAAKVLLLQNEIPEATNLAIARAARAQHTRVLLNAAPARILSPELAGLIDVLIVNRVEAGMMAAATIASVDDALAALPALATAATSVIVTLGHEGFIIRDGDQPPRHVPAAAVTVSTSHGAGDTFCGALAAGLAAGAALGAAAIAAGDAASRYVAGHMA